MSRLRLRVKKIPAPSAAVSKDSFMVLVTRPISATMLAMAGLAVVAVPSPALQKKREEALHEEE
jgi:TctA family transporter